MRHSHVPLGVRLLAAFCILLLNASTFSVACFGAEAGNDPVKEDSVTQQKQVLEVVEDAPTKTETNHATKPADAVMLSPDRLKHLASLMPPFSTEHKAPEKFVLQNYSRKPPAVKDIVEIPFPLPASPTKSGSIVAIPHVKLKPLEVLRINHSGAVEHLGALDITFNQPMVPITTIESTDAHIPATITPQIDGKWQWTDAKTLSFLPSENKGRFSFATTYEVTIPAGTEAENGQKLAKDVVSKFTTPEPQVVSVYAHQTADGCVTSLNPEFQITFSQPIKIDSLRKLIHGSSNNETLDFVIAPKSFSKSGVTSVVYALPTRELKPDTNYCLTVDAGVQSTEGPNPRTEPYIHNFHTYRPFALYNQGIALHRGAENEPISVDINLSFNNELKEAQDLSASVIVTPRIPRMRMTQNSSTISIHGDFKNVSQYKVRLNQSLCDVHGQHLFKRTSATLTLTKHPPEIGFDNAHAITQLLPQQKAKCRIKSFGVSELTATFYQVDPQHPSVYYYRRPPEHDPVDDLPVIARRKIKLNPGLRGYLFTDVDLPNIVKQKYKRCLLEVRGKNCEVPIRTWVEYSPLGMHIWDDKKTAHILAFDAERGIPLDGAELTFLPSGLKAKTDKRGLASIALSEETSNAVICSHAEQELLYFGNSYLNLQKGLQTRELRWYAQSDRNLYRPGETVTFAGWVRNKDYDSQAVLEKLPEGATINYQVTCDSNRIELAHGVLPVHSDGGFELKIPIPSETELGNYSVQLYALNIDAAAMGSTSYSTRFTVQEFRKPETEVAINPGKRLLQLGEVAHVKAIGTYGSGGALSHAKVSWKVSSSHGSFTPPGWSGYDFTPVLLDDNGDPWQSHRIGYHHLFRGNNLAGNDATVEIKGVTASDGSDSVSVSCKKLDFPEPITLRVEATIQDLTRQEWTSSTALTVIPSDLFVGISSRNNRFNRADKKEFDLVVVDKKGKAVAGVPIQLQLNALKGKSVDGQWVDDPKFAQSLNVTSGDQPLQQFFKIDDPGLYKVTATVKDSQQRVVISSVPLRVLSEPEERAEGLKAKHNAKLASESASKALTLSCDKTEYNNGDTAKISIVAPFSSGHGVLVYEKSRIDELIPFDITDSKVALTIPIDKLCYPRCNVSVSTYSADGISSNGAISLNVPAKECALSVVVSAEKKNYEPDSEASVSVAVIDSQKAAVSDARVTVAVVDEAVLNLTGYMWYDPLQSFVLAEHYFGNHATAEQLVLRKLKRDRSQKEDDVGFIEIPRELNLFQVEPTVFDERHYTSGRQMDKYTFFASPSVGLGGGADVAAPRWKPPTFTTRTNFDALAFFKANITTDNSGRAKVTFKLPSNLTKYRVFAFATKDDDKFGLSSATEMTVNKTLMVRPSFPRFLNYGDHAYLTMVLENKSNNAANADIVMHAKNLMLDPGKESVPALTGFTGRSVKVSAHDRVEVRIPVEPKLGGAAYVQVATISGSAQDSAELSFPLQPPISSEDFADYGQIDSGAIERTIKVPPNVIPTTGKLEISLSSTAIQKLSDPARYLIKYPFECSEQLSSKVIGLVSLKNILAKFPKAAQHISAAQIDDELKEALALLIKRQRNDGSFQMWGGDSNSSYRDYFVSLQAIESIVLAEQSGCKVPSTFKPLCQYILGRVDGRDQNSELNPACIFAIRAYACRVRDLMGARELSRAEAVVADAIEHAKAVITAETGQSSTSTDLQRLLASTLSLESMAWLLPTMSDSKKRDSIEQVRAMKAIIASHVDEQASTASIEDGIYESDWYMLFYSRVRATAVVMQSMIEIDHDSDLIAKLAKTLSSNLSNGHWSNTQDNARALAAMCKYFSTYEKESPEFTALAWLGRTCVLNQTFVGRNLDERKLAVPMQYLVAHPADTSFILDKDGPGRLYYRVGLNYALRDQKQPAMSRGFTVARKYEAVDDESDVVENADGSWHVKAGATVKVTVRIDTPGLRHHVAVSDQLPAAFETINMEFRGNRTLPSVSRFKMDTQRAYRYYQHNFEHMNYRDSRTEAFASLLQRGHYEITYLVRATTHGTFIVPPCKVEEMYTPETFGRTATTKVVVD